MAFYAGFDILQYPNMAMMNWLNQNTNLVWCGYYLAPAPNRPTSQWMGKYSAIKDKWGVLPVYVGQQDERTGHGSYEPSSILTAKQGAIDGADACNLLAGEGFQAGTFVYLDWEYGGSDGKGSSDYIKAWISAVVADGRARPGIYCSHVVAHPIVNVIDAINPTPITRFWCWKVPNANSHDFQGDISNLPEINPAGCGFLGAQMWQREQQAIVTFPNGAPIASLTMDFSTSSLEDPGAPGTAMTDILRVSVIADPKKAKRPAKSTRKAEKKGKSANTRKAKKKSKSASGRVLKTARKKKRKPSAKAKGQKRAKKRK
jgi:hypothetical protein